MATRDQKKLYNDRVKPYKSKLEELKKKSSSLKVAARKNSRMEPYFVVQEAVISVQMANILVQMSSISQAIVSFKNDSLLNDARKEIGSAINNLLKLVGEYVDGSLTDNEENLKRISRTTPLHRLNLLVGIKEALDSIQEGMGVNSKWRWYFPDLYYKLAITAKNMVDFKEFDRIRRDPQAEFNREYQELVRFVIQESHDAAQLYRSKYELSTNEVSDLQIIQRIFEMMKRIYQFTGNKTEMEKVKTSLDAITEKVNIKMAEKEKKKK